MALKSYRLNGMQIVLNDAVSYFAPHHSFMHWDTSEDLTEQEAELLLLSTGATLREIHGRINRLRKKYLKKRESRYNGTA